MERLDHDWEDWSIAMVSIEQKNTYDLRDYLVRKVLLASQVDPFKSCFVFSLGLTDQLPRNIDLLSLSPYQKCAISGLAVLEQSASQADLIRLLGQSSQIDTTPMPWMSDMIGVMSVKSLVDEQHGDEMKCRFNAWIAKFLPRQLRANRLNVFELDFARYMVNPPPAVFQTSTVQLYLHYSGKLKLNDQKTRYEVIGKFMEEFKYHGMHDISPSILALMVYCFDQASKEIALVPSKGWSLDDLVLFLNQIPVGLKRWTWEKEKGRTKGTAPVKWPVENEYHIQNLLYILLAPAINDVADEISLQQVGQKNPRADLYLPGLNTIIEVKYRKNSTKSFSKLIGEVAEDASLYHADSRYKDAKMVCFLWDHTISTQEHAKFKEGILRIQGIDACVVINAPSFMWAPAKTSKRLHE